KVPHWMPLLKRIKAGGKLCQVGVDLDGALEVVREVGGRGLCLVVGHHPQMPPEEIDDFLAVLAKEDVDAVH
ncbi:MAG: hypothetical protein QGG73_10275, partial [Candidatus Hydrogenedentes bacterium]|nr:hypothetical protein [Candidatus Hydrogenedentota bacterium]